MCIRDRNGTVLAAPSAFIAATGLVKDADDK